MSFLRHFDSIIYRTNVRLRSNLNITSANKFLKFNFQAISNFAEW